MIKPGLAHCCHHDTHWEFCYDYDERVKYIQENKPKEEQELRLKLFFLVPDDKIPGRGSALWKAFETARKAYDTEWTVRDTAWEACNTARKAYVTAWRAYLKAYARELGQLHTELCPDCTWNGKTIFTRQNDKGEYY